jgi:cytochrome oxidase Cu insertion factor (SCO1/SenC/PrrC family)
VAAMASFIITGCFPKKPGPRLKHYYSESPAEGQRAPNFELRAISGIKVSLKDLIGEKPIVLQLGSHTCPVYRYRRWHMDALYREYKDRVHFLLVYTLEAHPKGSKNPYVDKEWVSMINRLTRNVMDQPRDMEARLQRAKESKQQLNIKYPMAVDGMENQVWKDYGRAPSTAFVIDQHGNIALRQPWINPKEIKEILDKLLNGPVT